MKKQLLLLLAGFFVLAAANAQDNLQIRQAKKVNDGLVQLDLSDGHRMYLDFYGDNIFRWYYNPETNEMVDPKSNPPAQILVKDAQKKIRDVQVGEDAKEVRVSTSVIEIKLNKSTLRIEIYDKRREKNVVSSALPFLVGKKESVLRLTAHQNEYFFGGGVQNGRFSHKGKIIAIENQNSWTDGGVASPVPFYWSTDGYAFMWYTFKKGHYDFGKEQSEVVKLTHETSYLDVFFMVDATPASLLADYYQLTGKPVLLPGFAFYEGHLNAYNRDYWKEDPNGILFEDGKRYLESQKDNGGIKESLNGEKNNYQFSARAVVDRYQKNNMPLGWILPNDGYGAGYGQASTLDSNILNLKLFGDYTRSKGVQIGLWTQSDLHPKPGISALLQRDLDKEVGVAGVRVLKTDVAWVGAGYSFGLHGIADAASIMKQFGNDARPFIITLDGWAGTQRYGSVWTGDQTGGEWEYIRFHIPTYIGSGLSGIPNITSDMDGIFGGKNPIVNIRDYQWKTFTLMQLNMDGWGLNPKYPFALGEPATSINRNYLKLKSELFPYIYSVAHQATEGLPTLRATFLEEQNAFTLGTATQYQFFSGPFFLVAPVYKNTTGDSAGNDLRDGIYLPKGKWIDYFDGTVYEGNLVINNYAVPIWKIPVFVKPGAIIPMANPNNDISELNTALRIFECYPFGKSSFVQYDDDKLTNQYQEGVYQTTLIESEAQNGTAKIWVHPAKGSYPAMVRQKETEFRINVSQKPETPIVWVNGKKIKLARANSINDYAAKSNVYFFNEAPEFNQFSTPGSEAAKVHLVRNPQLWVKVGKQDITTSEILLQVNGFKFQSTDPWLKHEGSLPAPSGIHWPDSIQTAYSLTPFWAKEEPADYYEIEFNGMIYGRVRNNYLSFDGLQPETEYSFRIRSVNKSGKSEWVPFIGKTKKSPLEYAIRGITATTSVLNQEGEEIEKLFDFDESDMWHTKYGQKATPFEMVLNLNTINQLDHLSYLPRDRGNGIILKGEIWYSMDGTEWKSAGTFDWKYNGDTKEFRFAGTPWARYLKIKVIEARGNYGSGRELYIFKVPGSESQLPGDINHDGKIDMNDLTSYMNYTGLRRGDADFEGYISKGDLNGNGLIDAYDISNVATRLNGGITANQTDSVSGSIQLIPDKTSFRKNDILTITVKGIDLNNVNALSFALPYDESEFEFLGITPLAVKQMDNMTNNRLHADGQRVLYPTFVNIGEQPLLKGTEDLFQIRLKARKNGSYSLRQNNGMLVGRNLKSIKF